MIKCENCAYWCRYSNGGSGECRRHAPAPMYSMTGDKPGPIWWPQTLSGFWCGDFKKRPAEFITEQAREVADNDYRSEWMKLMAPKFPDTTPKKSQKKLGKKI